MRLRLLLASMIVLAAALPAGAVIKVDLTVANMYESAKAVATGTITKLNPDSRVIEVKLNPLFRGEGLGESIKAQIPAEVKLAPSSARSAGAAADAQHAELITKLAAEQPIVIFVGKAKGGSLAVMHLADEWVLAEMMPNNPAAWRVLQLHNAKLTFPGRTAALVAAVTELKAGKSTLLNEVEEKLLHAEPKERLKLSAMAEKPLSMATLPATVDKGVIIAIGTRTGISFAASEPDAKLPAAGLTFVGGQGAVVLAAGELTGKDRSALLYPWGIWTQSGTFFTKLDLPELKEQWGGTLLAAGLSDVNGDKKADAVFIAAAGQVLVFENSASIDGGLPARRLMDGPPSARPARALWKDRPALAAAIGGFGEEGKPAAMVAHKDGIVRYSLDGKAPPADHERLTGHKLDAHHKELAGELKDVRLLRLDVNGDGRDDLLVLANSKALLLVNRGFGVFLVNPDPVPGLLAGLDKLGQFVWAAGDVDGDKHDEILLLKADGTLLVLANKPPAAQK